MPSSFPSNVTIVDDALSVDLPKWPGLIVEGTSVTPQQAREILIRTDSHLPAFRGCSNAQHLEDYLSLLFGIKGAPDTDPTHWHTHWEAVQNLRKRLRMVEGLQYLSNAQILSCWVGGPHGWCSWDGIIRANTFNIGKWPSVDEVIREWAAIAEAFPYLTLTAWLHDKESCQEGAQPIVRFEVERGHVVAFRQWEDDLKPSIPFEEAPFVMRHDESGESGIDRHVLRDYLEDLYGGSIPQYNL